jgi:uncharacterized spore protein YtfJ
MSVSLNRLFEVVDKARDTAQWQAAFGEPHVVGDKTLIPVAQTRYGFGLGFGSEGERPEEQGEPAGGAGGGAGGSAKPLGVIVVTPEDVYFEEVEDSSKIALSGIAMVAFIVYQVARTVRVISRRK